MFYASDGNGAYQNGSPITPTDRDRLDESMLLSGYDPDGGFLSVFYQKTQGVRRLGSAALNLAYVATGSADAVWEYDTYPWDVSAGICILREAGGQVTNDVGERYAVNLDASEDRTSPVGVERDDPRGITRTPLRRRVVTSLSVTDTRGKPERAIDANRRFPRTGFVFLHISRGDDAELPLAVTVEKPTLTHLGVSHAQRFQRHPFGG